MKPNKLLFLFPLAFFLASCGSVLASVPVGDTVVQLSPEQWQGTWLHQEVVVTTNILDKDNGLLQASWIERREEGVGLEVAKGTVRATGDKTFFVTRDENRNELFLWARVKKGDNYLIMWPPNVEQFRILINNGELAGELTEHGVVLGELKPEFIEMIDDPSANLLDWKNPHIFVRIGN